MQLIHFPTHQNNLRVFLALLAKRLSQEVLSVSHVLLDKQEQRVRIVWKENIVLGLIISQQFVVTVLEDITKETKHKHRAFPVFQAHIKTNLVGQCARIVKLGCFVG